MPGIPLTRVWPCHVKRDGRDKPGHDSWVCGSTQGVRRKCCLIGVVRYQGCCAVGKKKPQHQCWGHIAERSGGLGRRGEPPGITTTSAWRNGSEKIFGLRGFLPSGWMP